MVTRPLENGVALAQDIAQGRLDRPVSVDSNNEIGQMQQALRDMRDSLARVVGRVRRGTDAVASASGRIEAGNADLTHSTQSQTQALQRTTESIAQLSAAARQNADSASQGRQLVESATRVATEGSAVVSRAVATMDTIQGASARIQDIVGVIDGIAFQTNILALNAAVEASRAGEQGRGFAVVAAEVRSLALRSTQAAGQIKTLIQDSVQQVDSGTRLVHQAGATVQAIHASVQQVQRIMGEINAASLHQLSGIAQVNDAITQMADATQRNAELVHQAEAATRALHDQAAELEAAVGLFQLGEDAAAQA
jgi:methyl-accepting chemotaxis protein